uniref:Ig-like domain-containing protein n=1 Tax=Poecilia reticulata TaxID=8081 RepID=A0A3P9P655_POERE
MQLLSVRFFSDPSEDLGFLLNNIQLNSHLFLSLIAATGTVSCLHNQDCILPCRIDDGIDSITWKRENQQSQIVSYDQASLSEDQISRGNGDLLLRGVKVDDERKYLYSESCTFILGFPDTFFCKVALFYFLILFSAPVSDIRIHQDGNRITCSSEGIYPQPELTWSTEPPSNTALNETTRIHQTEDQLYDISSSLTGPDLIYSCSIRTRRNQRRATLDIPGPESSDNI